jgi:hypothetical protein
MCLCDFIPNTKIGNNWELASTIDIYFLLSYGIVGGDVEETNENYLTKNSPAACLQWG